MIPGGRGEKQVLAGVISVIRTITLVVLTSECEKEIVEGKAFRNCADFRTRDEAASRAQKGPITGTKVERADYRSARALL